MLSALNVKVQWKLERNKQMKQMGGFNLIAGKRRCFDEYSLTNEAEKQQMSNLLKNHLEWKANHGPSWSLPYSFATTRISYFLLRQAAA